MLGCVETEGKLVTSQHFYNVTTNVSPSLLHLQLLARQRPAQVCGWHPNTGWGQKVRGTLKCWRPAQYTWYCRVNPKSNGLWEKGMRVLIQVSLTQLRQWSPLTWTQGWGNTVGNLTPVRRSTGWLTPITFLVFVFAKKGKRISVSGKYSWFLQGLQATNNDFTKRQNKAEWHFMYPKQQPHWSAKGLLGQRVVHLSSAVHWGSGALGLWGTALIADTT